MDHDEHYTRLIYRLIDLANNTLGHSAIKLATKIDGIIIKTNGDLQMSGDKCKIFDDLQAAYESEMKAKIVIDESSTRMAVSKDSRSLTM